MNHSIVPAPARLLVPAKLMDLGIPFLFATLERVGLRSLNSNVCVPLQMFKHVLSTLYERLRLKG